MHEEFTTVYMLILKSVWHLSQCCDTLRFHTLSLNLMQLFEFHFSSALSRKIPALALTLCDSNPLHLQSTRGRFSTESRKTKSKDITATKVKLSKLPKTRENAGNQVTKFTADWRRWWREFFLGLITEWSEAKPKQSRIIFDTQFWNIALSIRSHNDQQLILSNSLFIFHERATEPGH